MKTTLSTTSLPRLHLKAEETQLMLVLLSLEFWKNLEIFFLIKIHSFLVWDED